MCVHGGTGPQQLKEGRTYFDGLVPHDEVTAVVVGGGKSFCIRNLLEIGAGTQFTFSI